MLTKKSIEKIAELSKIPLKGKELSVLSARLQKIISFVEVLKKLKTQNIEPTYQVTGKENEFRQDISSKSLLVEEVLRNAKEHKGDYLLTKGVLDAK